MSSDVIIIGGGVLGISLAYHLSVQRVRSVVLEREPLIAQHASAKNAGMIRKLYRHPQLTEWAHRSTQLWPSELKSAYFRETGSVIVGREVPSHHRELFEQITILRKHANGDSRSPAVYTASDGLLDPEGYVQALFKLTDRSHCTVRCGRKVSAVRHTGKIWTVETEQNETFEAPIIVNAAGAWLNEMLVPYCPWLTVDAAAYARHLFLIEGWSPDDMPTDRYGYVWDEEYEWYARQWDAATRLVSVCDRTAADPDNFSPPAETVEQLAAALRNALGGEEHLRLRRAWHCFRTYTDDQLPIWGEDPDAPGLFWLAAFGGFGMSTSFAATLDAARAILGEPIEISSDFSPSRAKITPSPQRSTTIM